MNIVGDAVQRGARLGLHRGQGRFRVEHRRRQHDARAVRVGAEAAHHHAEAPRETRGERLTRLYLTMWEQVATGQQMQVLARSALSNETAAAAIRDIFGGGLAEQRDKAIADGRKYGTTLAMTHLFGVAFARYVLRVPQLIELDLEALVARISPSVQLHLDTPDE